MDRQTRRWVKMVWSGRDRYRDICPPLSLAVDPEYHIRFQPDAGDSSVRAQSRQLAGQRQTGPVIPPGRMVRGHPDRAVVLCPLEFAVGL